MAARFEFTPRAALELALAFERLTERSPEFAERWRDGLFAKIETLRNFPKLCPIAPEARRWGAEVRELSYGKRQQGIYRILYRVDGDVIQVLAIVHSSKG